MDQVGPPGTMAWHIQFEVCQVIGLVLTVQCSALVVLRLVQLSGSCIDLLTQQCRFNHHLVSAPHCTRVSLNCN